MIGYIIELYKNIISDDETQESDNKALKANGYTTFGDFDRMAVSKTTAFSRMRDMSQLSRTWTGDRQTILLYELSDDTSDNSVVYKDTYEEKGFYIRSREKGEIKSQDLFVGVSILQFKNSPAEENLEASKYIIACRDKIIDIIKRENKDNVHCSVLGVLASYGVAIIWAADQYTDILELINKIKETDFSSGGEEREGYPYLSVYTIIAKNNLSKDIIKSKKDQIRGKAMLHLTLKKSLNQKLLDDLHKDIGDVQQFHSFGEHDLLVIAESKKIYELFEDDALLDRDNDFHEKYILQSNTKLCSDIPQQIKNTPPIVKESGENQVPKQSQKKNEKDNKDTDESKKIIYKCYQRLRKLFFDKFPKTAGMVDSLDLLYGDYLSKIATVSNKMWTADFSYQFHVILEIIYKNLSKVIEHKVQTETTEALEDVREILNCFEYQIVHIAESNNLVLETPKCHLRYTGQNNLTLYAYFGIVKDILQQVYQMQDMSRQPEIVPLILVDMVPIIESTLYPEYENKFGKQLLKLNLPMMALYNIPIYAPYLYHEIFHYVVPKDRAVRNWYKGNILITLAMNNLVLNTIRSWCAFDDPKLITALVDNVFSQEIYRTIAEKRKQEIPAILKNDECKLKRGEINSDAQDNGSLTAEAAKETCCRWEQYEYEMFRKIYESIICADKISLDQNIVYQIFRCFYVQKDSVLNQTKTWLEKESPILGKYKQEIFQFMDYFLNDILSPIVLNTNDENKLKSYLDLISNSNKRVEELIEHDELFLITNSINEAVCDIAMVDLAEMDAANYLLSYVKIQNDLLRSNDSMQKVQDLIRIGIVLDHIYGFQKLIDTNIHSLKLQKDKFIHLYLGLYFSVNTFGSKESLDYITDIKKDAQKWFDKILGWYQQYSEMYRMQSYTIQAVMKQYSVKERMNSTEYSSFSQLNYKESYEAMEAYGNAIDTVLNDSGNTVSFEEKLKVIKKARQDFRRETFQMNIRIIQSYQYQKNFGEINTLREKNFKKDEPYKMVMEELPTEFAKYNPSVWNSIQMRLPNETCSYTYEITGIEQLCSAIQNVSKYFTDRSKETYVEKVNHLWYRGHGSTKYKLLPSAMRKWGKSAHSRKDLRDHLRAAFEEFKFRLDDASEKIDTSSYTACDHLALMQHYGVPTIYLDWTENAITALYFALEAYIDPHKDSEKNNDDAVLYIMHPNLYNKARDEMMETYEGNSGMSLDSDMQKTKQIKTDALPNLSVDYNKDKYYMFLLGETDEKKVPDRISTEGYLADGNDAILCLPLAIYSSRANMRIRSQYGMFIAFNIFTPPNKSEKFEYMALEDVQNAYLRICKDKSPFMFKIVIRNESKQQIAEWLKAIGVSKEMIYPELSSIGERI